jgi:uncharacterized membrane protein YphA (DoxX/SURF4 family)
LVGLLTALSAALMAVGSMSTALSWVRPPGANVLEPRLVALLVAVIATAVVLLGPGALSMDARLFGRREIIIPPSARPARP